MDGVFGSHYSEIIPPHLTVMVKCDIVADTSTPNRMHLFGPTYIVLYGCLKQLWNLQAGYLITISLNSTLTLTARRKDIIQKPKAASYKRPLDTLL
jgi:hypothetical protein